MKKQKNFKVIAIVLILITLMLVLVGCGNSENTTTLTAEEIANSMKSKNSNIGNVIVYTEETDVNGLLGRPGQYTSKVNFEDTRAEQLDPENPVGGSIEVFENEKDMKERKEYIEGFSTSSMFSQYVYSKGNVLLRIDGDLTPTQAKEYETLLNEIL